MLNIIDKFLNRITMYRLVIYCLTFLLSLGFVLSFFGTLGFSPLNLLVSSIIIFTSCIALNYLFEIIFRAPSNPESTYITSLILCLIIGPENSFKGYFFLLLICFIAISSKYLIAINKKHIFNPAGFAVAILALFSLYYPSWWIGSSVMFFPVLITGLLITRKIQKFDLVISFIGIYILTSIGGISSQAQFFKLITNLFVYSPILFFAFVMLPEPSTTPPRRLNRVVYGALIALLIAPFFHIGQIYFSLELALVLANIFSFLVSPKIKTQLIIKEKNSIAKNTFEFSFLPEKKFNFKPGQYMEWTVGHKKYDSRGVRRYFTIASSPTESLIKVAIKFYENPSTFKKNLLSLDIGDKILASQLSGEFVLPQDKTKKLVFIAGGIGITPFRSMIKYLIDKNDKRDISVFYSAQSYDDLSYKEIFEEAEKKLGIKTIYILNNKEKIPPDFKHESGLLNVDIIKKVVPNFKDCMFYISGPKGMIDSFNDSLRILKVSRLNIKTDFFPGYA